MSNCLQGQYSNVQGPYPPVMAGRDPAICPVAVVQVCSNGDPIGGVSMAGSSPAMTKKAATTPVRDAESTAQ
jgi:hypothetical protein